MVLYWSFRGVRSRPGFHLVGGTSEAAPLFAGMIAIAGQIRGGRVGWINPLLYRLGASGGRALRDVTLGDNHFTFADAGGRVVTVPGSHAVPGYDLASGWGTVDATFLCPVLAAGA
jgi:subtilase family serine protease